MKTLISIIAFLAISNFVEAQNPCYVKYTYDASGNRVKREFICAPVDTIYSGGGTTTDDDCCPSAKMTNNNNNTNGEDFDFDISPNPANSEISLSINNNNKFISGSIFNNLGQEILKFEINTNFHKIDLTKFSAGIYYAMLQNEKKKIIKKFVKTD